MRNEIEKAIKETLVIENKQSVHIAVDKINKLLLEALERDRTSNLKHIQEDYKCSVCGNSEFEQK